MLNAHIAYKISNRDHKMLFLEFNKNVIDELLRGDSNEEQLIPDGTLVTPNEKSCV